MAIQFDKIIIGGLGDDILQGGDGIDVIIGKNGNDILKGLAACRRNNFG